MSQPVKTIETVYIAPGVGQGSGDHTGSGFKARFKSPVAGWWNQELSYTGTCPAGRYGLPVTQTIAAGNVFSNVSQQDANAKASALLIESVNNALDCNPNPVINFVRGDPILLMTQKVMTFASPLP